MRGELVSEREAKEMLGRWENSTCGRIFDKKLVERILKDPKATGLWIRVGIEGDNVNFILSAVDDNDQPLPNCELAERGKIPD